MRGDESPSPAREIRVRPTIGPRGDKRDDPVLEELRTILLQGDRDAASDTTAALARLEARLISLEDALRRPQLRGTLVELLEPARAGEEDAFDKTFARIVFSAFMRSAPAHRREIVNLLYPFIGPLIRKAAYEALRSYVETVSALMERTVSLESLWWRWEAWRTHRPFEEVMILRTMRFHVDFAYLVHTKSGTLLADARARDLNTLEPSLVSAMLTAIRAFAQDAMRARAHEPLRRIEFGDRTLWIEEGPQCFLALCVTGRASPDWHRRCKETLERIHAEFFPELEGFTGDVSAFEDAKPLLAQCLDRELNGEAAAMRAFKSRRRRSSVLLGCMFITLLVLALAAALRLHGH